MAHNLVECSEQQQVMESEAVEMLIEYYIDSLLDDDADDIHRSSNIVCVDLISLPEPNPDEKSQSDHDDAVEIDRTEHDEDDYDFDCDNDDDEHW